MTTLFIIKPGEFVESVSSAAKLSTEKNRPEQIQDWELKLQTYIRSPADVNFMGSKSKLLLCARQPNKP